MKTPLTTLFALAAFATCVSAAPQTFDFKDPKGVNHADFKLDAHLEAISGSASGISGTVTFDPDQPAATKGKILVASESLTVPNAMMKGQLQSATWLDVKKFPEISFTVKELKNAKTQGDDTTAEVSGTFECKGVSKEMTVPVKLTYLKGKLAQRLQGMPGTHEGDLLVIRASFSIKRSDFNINPGQFEDKVANEIQLTLSIAGASPK
jgi:polyisoprenoid-binding protein YceI